MTGEPLSGDLVYPAPESSCSKNCASKFVTRNHNGRSQEVSVSGGEGGVYGKANEKSDGGIGVAIGLLLTATLVVAQNIVVDVTPSHVVNTFSPPHALGGAIDR